MYHPNHAGKHSQNNGETEVQSTKPTSKNNNNNASLAFAARSAAQSANDAPMLEARLSDIENADARVWRSLAVVDNSLASPLVGINAALKRLEDFVLASIALLLLMPLMVVISILIKLDSTGPALFCQNRNGRNKEVIRVYKFRTMYQDLDATFKQAHKGDPRITRIGAFLRRTSLDELPQLFNVIQGSMSLVGPRPHPLALDESFKFIIPALSSRYAVKPGITGWAQISGFRGETSKVSDMVSRFEHDRQYINSWSLWLDAKILVLTVLKGWTHENAY